MAETKQTVYQKIAAVQGALAKVGISKSRKNQTPGASYQFRGIDEVYNTLAPMMAEHGLCILPRIVDHKLTERGKTSRGNAIYSAVVTAEFDFVSADDGTVHVVRTVGEAMDSSDKASNKAMSAAYKYAALMTFAIPTEGDNDADAHTHEVVAQLISDVDWALLTQLIEATGTDAAKLCKAYKADSLKAMTAENGADAIAVLQKRLAEKAKKEADNGAAE